MSRDAENVVYRRVNGSVTVNGARNSAVNTATSSPPEHYEFGGPNFVAFVVVSLPITVAALFYCCNDTGCASLNPNDADFLYCQIPTFSDTVDGAAFAAVVLWIGIHCALYVVVPGRRVCGVPIQNFGELKYTMNGASCAIITLTALVVLVAAGILSPTAPYDKLPQLIVAAVVVCAIMSAALYASSYAMQPDTSIRSATSTHGRTPSPIYNFFMGRTLNPRIGDVDLKFICELRPGLIGWIIIVYAAAIKQYTVHGEVTLSIILIIIFQTAYVADALWNEEAILTTMDITTDGFGYMLVFGDLTWVPFTYSLQARYLVSHPVELSVPFAVVIVAINFAGFYIFRSANGQKNVFRTQPKDDFTVHAKFIATDTSSRLLCSGWWGLARHANYFGDWLMAISWCLPCGFEHPIPYFYLIYFTALLIHRERRDDDKCRRKYGIYWEQYCQRVPARIIPYIY